MTLKVIKITAVRLANCHQTLGNFAVNRFLLVSSLNRLGKAVPFTVTYAVSKGSTCSTGAIKYMKMWYNLLHNYRIFYFSFHVSWNWKELEFQLKPIAKNLKNEIWETHKSSSTVENFMMKLCFLPIMFKNFI